MLQNHPSSNHLFPLVEHNMLAGGLERLWSGKMERALYSVVPQGAVELRREGTRAAGEGGGAVLRRRVGNPVNGSDVDGGWFLGSFFCDNKLIFCTIFLYNLEGDFEAADPEPPPLADGVERHAIVASDNGAVAPDDVAGAKRIAEVAPEESLWRFFREEAEILAFPIGFSVVGYFEAFRESVRFALQEGAEGEEHARQLFLRQPIEVVALVLGFVDGFEEVITKRSRRKRRIRGTGCSSVALVSSVASVALPILRIR